MPLDFANETWIRVYKRDTVTLKLLPWQARALLWELLRKADRAGVVDVGDSAERGIAALVSMPLDVTTSAMAELLTHGVLRGGNGCYVFPRFLEAQETPQSDRLRAKATRERRRDNALNPATSRDESVTNRDEVITESDESVTPRHAASLQEEKRQEDTKQDEKNGEALSAPPKPKRVKRTKCQLPADWEADMDSAMLAAQLGVNCVAESVKFRDHFQANGKLHVDWQAAFRNWLRRAAEWGASRGGPSGGVSVAHAELARLTREAKARGEVVDDCDLFGGAS